MEKFTPLATNFTLPPALTGWTNSTSDIKLYCIYFKSMCLVTIPKVDYATLFCLEVTVTEETKELFIISILFKIIFHNSFNTWTIGRGLVQCSSGQ